MNRLRSKCANVSLIALLALPGCGALDIFGEDEVRLAGERKSVREMGRTAAPAAAEAIASGLTVVLPAPTRNASWPQMNGGAGRAIGHVEAGTALAKAWQTDIGSGSDGRIVSPPVIAAGRIFTLDTGATVSAVNESNGSEIWGVNLTPEGERAVDGFGGGLAVDGDTLFVSSGFGILHALDAATGASKWSASLRAPSRAAPVVSGGRVFAVTRENRLFAFDAATGEALWDQQGLEQTAGALGGAAPAATDDVVVAPYSSGELSAYVAASGRAVWDQELTGLRGVGGLSVLNDVAGDPVIADGVVYAASQSGRLVAVDLRNGDRLWTRDVGGNHPPYIAGRTLFFVSNGGVLMALAADTGETIWETSLGAFQDAEQREDPIVWAGPVLAGGRLLLVSNTERMVSIDAVSGEVRGELDLPSGASTPPVVANGTVYVLTDSAALAAYR